jgi:hypothetical protein
MFCILEEAQERFPNTISCETYYTISCETYS